MMRVGTVFQHLAGSEGWWERPQDVAAAAELLNLCHHWAVGARLITAQYLAAWAQHLQDPALQQEHINLVHPRFV